LQIYSGNAGKKKNPEIKMKATTQSNSKRRHTTMATLLEKALQKIGIQSTADLHDKWFITDEFTYEIIGVELFEG